MKGLPK